MSGAREEQVSFSITEDDVCNVSVAYNVILRRPKSGICGLSRSYGLWSQEFLWVWFLKAVLWIFVGTSVHKARALQACFQKLDISMDWHLQSQTFILCWILTSSACFTLDNRLSTAPIVFLSHSGIELVVNFLAQQDYGGTVQFESNLLRICFLCRIIWVRAIQLSFWKKVTKISTSHAPNAFQPLIGLQRSESSGWQLYHLQWEKTHMHTWTEWWRYTFVFAINCL